MTGKSRQINAAAARALLVSHTLEEAQQVGGRVSLLSLFEQQQWDLLLRRIHAGECTPFLGAGVSWPTLPTGGQLSRILARGYCYPLVDSSNLPRVGQYLAVRSGDPVDAKQTAADRIIRRTRRPPNFLADDDPHGILASLPLPVYLTTNWDCLMTMALRARGREVTQEVARWNSEVVTKRGRFSANRPSRDRPLVFHLHGHTGMAASMVLTEDDYIDFVAAMARDLKTVVPPTIQDALSFNSLLFIGYSLTDWNFHVLLRLLMRSLADAPRRLNVSVQLPNRDLIVDRREDDAKQFIADSLGASNVYIHWGEAKPFLVELKRRYRDRYGDTS